MLPHQQRVVTEKDELEDKLTKLVAFFETDFFSKIEKDEQERLKRQSGFMQSYLEVLEERISNF